MTPPSWSWGLIAGYHWHIHVERVEIHPSSRRAFVPKAYPDCVNSKFPIPLLSSEHYSCPNLSSSPFTFRVGRSPLVLAFTFHIRPCGSTQLAQSRETCSSQRQLTPPTEQRATVLLFYSPVDPSFRNAFDHYSLAFCVSTFRYQPPNLCSCRVEL